MNSRLYAVTFRGEEHHVEAIHEGDGVFDWWFFDPEHKTLRPTSEEHAAVEHQLAQQLKDLGRYD